MLFKQTQHSPENKQFDLVTVLSANDAFIVENRCVYCWKSWNFRKWFDGMFASRRMHFIWSRSLSSEALFGTALNSGHRNDSSNTVRAFPGLILLPGCQSICPSADEMPSAMKLNHLLTGNAQLHTCTHASAQTRRQTRWKKDKRQLSLIWDKCLLLLFRDAVNVDEQK